MEMNPKNNSQLSRRHFLQGFGAVAAGAAPAGCAPAAAGTTDDAAGAPAAAACGLIGVAFVAAGCAPAGWDAQNNSIFDNITIKNTLYIYFFTIIIIVNIKKNEVERGINILDIVIKSNLLKSKSEVRRAIKNLGIRVNNNTIDQENSVITINDFKDNILKLSHGKKNHILFKITN